VEDRFWENRLQQRLATLLSKGKQAPLESALAHLSKQSLEAFEVLAEQAETVSESTQLPHANGPVTALLLAIPVLAHTRYQIPAGTLKPLQAQALHQALHSSVAASASQLALAPFLFSLDHMPRVHHEVYALTQLLGQAALAGDALPKLPMADIETAPVLADLRFMLAAVVAPEGAALFRWQEEGAHYAERGDCLKAWESAAQPILAGVLPACILSFGIPDAFFVSCREAEKAMRPVALTAAINYLMDALSVTADELTAIIAPFGEDVCEEYRIGFSLGTKADVVYGVVWPSEEPSEEADFAAGLVDPSDAPVTDLTQIRSQLREAGVTNLVVLNDLFPPELCEDCGTPMFANRRGEVVHAEMPEDAPAQQPLFH
jgi:hypothetical protein